MKAIWHHLFWRTIQRNRGRWVTPGAVWLHGVVLLVAGLLSLSAQATSVLIVTSSPVAPGKFRMLAEVAEPHGVRIDSRYADKLPAEVDAGLFAGHDIVLFDTPRDHIRDAIRARLSGALPGLKVPSLWLHTSSPAWEGLPDELAKRLHSYYINGSKTNYQRFFESLAAYRSGRDWKQVAAPIVFPKSAIYHPDAPAIVFENTDEYFAWKKVDTVKRPPVIAIPCTSNT